LYFETFLIKKLLNSILKIAHRGATGHAPENTLIAFTKAIDLGCDGIELDVHCCKTGEIVVLHDETIDRTTSGNGFVKDLTVQDLQHYKIPTLEEVLNLINQQCVVNIELKTFETANKVVELINKYVCDKNWNYEHFLVSSFDWNALQKVHLFNNKIRIGVLTAFDLEKAIDFAESIAAFSINPYYKLLNQENVTLLRQNGFKIFPWTVNDLSAIEKMKLLKVDGIISDFIDRI
jgi:glycerophosphoryl diester phosphodiesterase